MQADMANPTLSITKLPNEVLRIILSFLPYHDFRDMLALRAVSRQFYFAVYETDFWYNDDLEFSIFRPTIPEHNRATAERRDYEKALADERLVKVLGHRRKSGWTFSGILGFLVVIERIPQFYQNARRINIYGIDHGLGVVIDKLASCEFVTRLLIEFSYESIDLDLIADSLPHLETLKIRCLDKYQGTLWHNKKLKRLSIHFHDSGSQMLTAALLPVDSARTLTSLDFSDCLKIAIDVPRNPFCNFHNLRHFHLIPLGYENGDFCDLLIETEVRLTTLQLNIFPESVTLLQKIISTFSGVCMRGLEKLTILMETDSFDPFVGPIIDAITSQLLSLKEVKLVMHLNLQWCEKFARWTNLRFLHYVIPATEKEFKDQSYIYQKELRLFGVKKTIENAFEKTFQGFAKKPQIEIEFDPHPY
jgi:hypothetical protein